MILISKQEASVVRDKFRDAAIYVTMRQKSKRKKYYTEERRDILALLHRMRTENVTEHYE